MCGCGLAHIDAEEALEAPYITLVTSGVEVAIEGKCNRESGEISGTPR